MTALPRISVVINTLNREKSLGDTLDGFRWQTYRGDFEIIVVNGPSTDGTQALIESWLPKIRIGRCPAANLSMSRNIGICMAAGDIVAFIDDDGIPEPEWLDQIASAYDSDEVGGAGGRVYDHTGYYFQSEYCLVDRLANADDTLPGPMPQRCFPGSFQFPHLLGTNATFRRSALLEIGGFDEEFDYFLDETDLCLRLMDAGYLIRQLDDAYVHHKYAASDLRTEKKVLRHRYPVMKNKIYFTLKHGRDYLPDENLIREQEHFIAAQRNDVRWCAKKGYLTRAEAEAFEKDAERAIAVGRARGEEGPIEQITPAKLERWRGDFTPFPVIEPERETGGARRAIVLVTQDYPPDHGGGIATFNKDLAAALAAMGHLVHVIARSDRHDRVDFEQGVWVHRIVAHPIPLGPEAEARGIPAHIWAWSAAALAETRRIASHRRIDVVETPIWDCQGAAFLLEGRWPLVVSLQTSLRFWLEGHPELREDRRWMAGFGTPMLALERELMEKANAVRAISGAIRRDIEAAYDFRFAEDQVVVSPLGLADPGKPAGREADGTTILFVGRLEHRKGIDVLLDAIPLVLAEEPALAFRIVGDDTIPGPGKKTYRSAFEKSEAGRRFASQVRFDGKIDDAALNLAYAECDLFLSPSRYESFGLIFLEAMRQAKPVIGCDVGGMPEIIAAEQTGLLVPPGDAPALAAAILRLARDPALRAAMGKAGRALFEEKFTDRAMAAGSLPLYDLARRRPPLRHAMKISYVNGICVKHDAISNAVRAEIGALRERGYGDVRLYAMACDVPDMPFTQVSAAGEILNDRHFRDSDLVVFHFGIWSPLFELLPMIEDGRQKTLVVFHNVTPKDAADEAAHATIDKSLAQMRHIRHADHVICVSETNLSVLRDTGIETPATVLPLAVPVEHGVPVAKPSFADGTLRLAFLGRFVRSKGPHELLAAVATLLARRPEGKIRLDLMGNKAFSDQALLAEIERTAESLAKGSNGRLAVTFHYGATEEVKRRLLREADIFALPTYHEGFCVPVVEALSHGDRIVTYDNSNMPAICNGLGRLVPTGDVAAFAQVLEEVAAEVLSESWRKDGYSAYAAAAGGYTAGFAAAAIGDRFVGLIEEQAAGKA
jgi:glycosyltransferase involved in cell wall biosynthesis